MHDTTSPVPYWRLSSFYFFYFALWGLWLPFWPLFLLEQGFDARAIGYLAGVMMATRIVAPVIWGWLADVTGQRLLIIRSGAFIALGSFLCIFIDLRFWWLAGIIVVYGFFWNAILAQFEALTFSHLRTHYQRYSRIRVWGSIGFTCAVLVSGVVFDYISVSWLPWAIVAILLGIGVSSLSVGEPATDEKHASVSEPFLQLIKQPYVICFFVSCFLLQVSHGPYYTFFSVLLEASGYSRTATGLFWSQGVLAEVVVFMIMHKLLDRFSLRQIMLVSLLLSVIRWLLIAFLVDDWAVLLFAQCLHAASFGSYHAVAVELIRRVFSGNRQGRAMATYSGVSFGGGSAVGAVLSGWGWSINQDLTFVAAAIVCLLALLLSLLPIANHPVLNQPACSPSTHC